MLKAFQNAWHFARHTNVYRCLWVCCRYLMVFADIYDYIWRVNAAKNVAVWLGAFLHGTRVHNNTQQIWCDVVNADSSILSMLIQITHMTMTHMTHMTYERHDVTSVCAILLLRHQGKYRSFLGSPMNLIKFQHSFKASGLNEFTGHAMRSCSDSSQKWVGVSHVKMLLNTLVLPKQANMVNTCQNVLMTSFFTPGQSLKSFLPWEGLVQVDL